VKSLSGLPTFEVSMISALPYVAASIGMILIGASSDRSGERLLHLAIPTAVGGLGFIASAYLSSPVRASSLLPSQRSATRVRAGRSGRCRLAFSRAEPPPAASH